MQFVMEISITEVIPTYLDVCFPQALVLKYAIVKLNIQRAKVQHKLSLKLLQHSFDQLKMRSQLQM